MGLASPASRKARLEKREHVPCMSVLERPAAFEREVAVIAGKSCFPASAAARLVTRPVATFTNPPRYGSRYSEIDVHTSPDYPKLHHIWVIDP
jgi:hypothetical protein